MFNLDLDINNKYPGGQLDELKKYNKSEYQEVKKHVWQQTHEAYNYMVSQGILFDRKTIKHMDTINIIDFKMPAEDTEAYELAKTSFFTYIPTIEKGVLKAAVSEYIYFEIYDINLKSQTYSMIMHEYKSEPNDEYLTWALSSYSDITVIKEEGKSCTIQVNEYYDFSDIVKYKLEDEIPIYKKIWSNKFERQFFNEVVAPLWKITTDKLYKNVQNHMLPYHDDDTGDENDKENKEDNFLNYIFNTSGLFLIYIAETNYMLSKNRPKAERNKTGHKYIDIQDKDNPKKPKRQIIRSVGGIKIKSVSVPKMPTEESIRKYKIASWNKRGHVRHYKNGKEVYIKPTTCRRKCFDSNEKPLQTIINIESRKEKI